MHVVWSACVVGVDFSGDSDAIPGRRRQVRSSLELSVLVHLSFSGREFRCGVGGMEAFVLAPSEMAG